MKVNVNPVEKKQGLVFKKTLHGVELCVDVDEEKVAKRGLVKSLATAAIAGTDALTYNLTFSKLLKGSDTYFFETPIEAKGYIDELKTDILPLTKAYLEENKEAATSDSFEL